MLALTNRGGCYLISFWLESGSQEILDRLGKATMVEQGIKAVEMIHAADIEVFGSFRQGSRSPLDGLSAAPAMMIVEATRRCVPICGSGFSRSA